MLNRCLLNEEKIVCVKSSSLILSQVSNFDLITLCTFHYAVLPYFDIFYEKLLRYYHLDSLIVISILWFLRIVDAFGD